MAAETPTFRQPNLSIYTHTWQVRETGWYRVESTYPLKIALLSKKRGQAGEFVSPNEPIHIGNSGVIGPVFWATDNEGNAGYDATVRSAVDLYAESGDEIWAVGRGDDSPPVISCSWIGIHLPRFHYISEYT